ncbi:hypothetical protein BC830DRAFT_1087109, partial [Chytriomyces sp. MP71]
MPLTENHFSSTLHHDPVYETDAQRSYERSNSVTADRSRPARDDFTTATTSSNTRRYDSASRNDTAYDRDNRDRDRASTGDAGSSIDPRDRDDDRARTVGGGGGREYRTASAGEDKPREWVDYKHVRAESRGPGVGPVGLRRDASSPPAFTRRKREEEEDVRGKRVKTGDDFESRREYTGRQEGVSGSRETEVRRDVPSRRGGGGVAKQRSVQEESVHEILKLLTHPEKLSKAFDLAKAFVTESPAPSAS